MIYFARLLSVDDEDGEVLVTINGIDLICMAVMPNIVEIGAICKVELTPQVFDYYEVKEVESDAPFSLMRTSEKTYEYKAVGELIGKYLDTGNIILEDDILLSDFSHLEGKRVEWTVNRFNVNFLSELEIKEISKILGS